MADSKITALTAISTVDPTADPLVIVDVSDTSMAASGTTKKITSNQILGSGGTATLASATITGNLTVSAGTANGVAYLNGSKVLTAGSALVFDGTNLGIAGAGQFRFATSGGAIGDNTIGTENSFSMMLRCGRGSTSNIELASDKLVFSTSASERYRIASDGVATWSNVGGVAGTAMTLNANGLGIGVTPSAWATYKALQIGNGSIANYSPTQDFRISSNAYYASGVWKRIAAAFASQYLLDGSSGTHQWYVAATGAADSTITTFASAAMTLDASGNLLVGKTAVSDLTVGFQATQSGVVGSTRASSSNTESTYFVYSTGAAAYRFYVGMGGTVYATNTTISGISDARFKENVQDIDVGLGAILALKPRKFDWKEGKGKNIKGDRGFIAQEFEQVFPNLVDEWKDEAPEGEAPYKSVRQDLIPVLVKAIQELTARVQTLEAK